MERSMHLVSASFVLVLLLVATASHSTTRNDLQRWGQWVLRQGASQAKVVEEMTCEAASGKFKGLCFSSNNCKHTCKREQFTGGKCRGFRHRCIRNSPLR
ncbi:unnamed protein product [Malus baccata var. baccata]